MLELTQKNANSKFIIIDRAALSSIKYIVTGFYGLGLCGFLTTKFFYEAAQQSNNISKVGIYWSKNLPPVVEVDANGGFYYPVELYKVSDNTGILMFRYQLHTSLHFDIGDQITDIAKNNDITLILAGGIDINAFPLEKRETADIVYTGNTPFRKYYIDNPNFQWDIEKSPSGIVVSGGIAIFLMFAEQKGVPAVSLLAPTLPKAGHMDYLASLKLAKRINNVFSMNINFDPIEREIKKQLEEFLSQETKIERELELEEGAESAEFEIT